MKQCFWFCFAIISILNYIQISNGQTCLTSPAEITWTLSPTSTYSATITFAQATKIWNNGDIELVTRLYNNLLPGPTLRMQRGNKYEVNFVNNLPAERTENAQLTGNQERDPNTANLHTHGLHISGLPNGDDVLTAVPPATSKLYTYNIPCTHSGGIHWYHSHHHPSVQLHVGGGAAGVIYVEDDASLEGLPSWYTGMKELIFWITHIDSQFIRDGYPRRTQAQRDNLNILNLTPDNEDIYLVNGEYQPTVCQANGEWIKFRFGQTEIWQPQRYQIGNTGDCTLKLLARDGVIVNNPPRSVGNIVWLAESSRADVAITCNAGTHSITELGSNMVIGYINSTGAATSTLTSFTPIRPDYLTDLSTVSVDNSLNIELRADTVVVGGSQQPFDETDPYFNGINPITIGSVNEWTLIRDNGGCCGGVFHPMHIHVNHFQVISGIPNGQLPGTDQPPVPETGYQQVGDWLDTYWGPGTIRFKPYIWGGPLVVHCHKLEHEVRGSMGAVLVIDGCDYNYGDYNGGTCTNPCSSTDTTTKAPTTISPTTQSPTTKSPTTQSPTTQAPTTTAPTSKAPTTFPTIQTPTTKSPSATAPTTTKSPTTKSPTTQAPTTQSPITQAPTTTAPTTKSPTTKEPTTKEPTAPSSCMPDGTQNCDQDSDCCDNWCDDSVAGAPSKCKVRRGGGPGGKGPGGKAAAQSESDSGGLTSSSSKMSGTTTGVVITCATMIGVFIICGFIICFKRKFAKQKQLPATLEMVEKNVSESNALPLTTTNKMITDEGIDEEGKTEKEQDEIV